MPLNMLKDLNYFPLDVESNIYGMTKLEFEDATSKILVATLDCRLYCINYNKFKPQTREVEFTYIPNGAKIISIGALKRGPNDFVIGITHSLPPSIPKASTSATPNPAGDISGHTSRQTTTYYFNIYASESVVSGSFDLDHVAQGCQTIRLGYVPYHLFSTDLLSYPEGQSSTDVSNTSKCKRIPIWLLSGSDECIHVYTEDQPYQSFTERLIEDCFPELSDKQQSLALWIDIVNLEHTSDNHIVAERAVALGFEDGSVRLYHSKLSSQTNKFETIRAFTFDAYSTIIPCVRLFTVNSIDFERSRLRQRLRKLDEINSICDISEQEHLNELNLLIVSSTNESIIFRDVLHKGLDDKYELPSSRRLDCVTAAAIGDTNSSGRNEVLLGTHGKELMTYRYDTESKAYRLNNVDILNYPVFSLAILDLTGDGLKDVTILLASGILVMQAAVKDVIKLCRRRLNVILSSLDLNK